MKKYIIIMLMISAAAFAATEKKINPKPVVREKSTVTLDVKDEDVRDILKSMQKQCGIKNLAIDPQVAGRGRLSPNA